MGTCNICFSTRFPHSVHVVHYAEKKYFKAHKILHIAQCVFFFNLGNLFLANLLDSALH